MRGRCRNVRCHLSSSHMEYLTNTFFWEAWNSLIFMTSSSQVQAHLLLLHPSLGCLLPFPRRNFPFMHAPRKKKSMLRFTLSRKMLANEHTETGILDGKKHHSAYTSSRITTSRIQLQFSILFYLIFAKKGEIEGTTGGSVFFCRRGFFFDECSSPPILRCSL